MPVGTLGYAAMLLAGAQPPPDNICRISTYLNGARLDVERHIGSGGARDFASFQIGSRGSWGDGVATLRWVDDGRGPPRIEFGLSDRKFGKQRGLGYRWRFIGSSGEWTADTHGLPPLRTIDWAALDSRFAGEQRLRFEVTRIGAGPANEVVVGSGAFDLQGIRDAIAANASFKPMLDRLAANGSCRAADARSLSFDFECSETWQSNSVTYTRLSAMVRWSIDLGDNVEFTVHDGRTDFYSRYDVALNEAPNHRGVTNQRAFASFIPTSGSRDVKESPGYANFVFDGKHYVLTNPKVAGVVRIGDTVFRQWLPLWSAIFLERHDWLRLRGTPGDLLIVAYHVDRGDIVRKTVTAAQLDAIDAEIDAGTRRLRERERAPDGKCTVRENEGSMPGDEIVI
ncbi:hypothetical protein P1X14_11855 [Sphingomonas sp. AOB5]|uniref:hypothetical protein n=1 Tax=Sphingomonas sp. AOB5 TaxID=3034017 RepID=UPI0023F72F76|nr:hypothetical protein [Sphingomonas sp. AOB5]MDF7775942.1 hypothetical protein [Sphingomonas sp. AOB5]